MRWALVIVLLAVLAVVAFRLVRSGSLPQIELAGVDVGALEEDALRQHVEEIALQRGSEEVEVQRAGSGSAEALSRSYERRELGYRLDVDATIGEILKRGRQGNPLVALTDQIKATFGTIEMDPVVSFDEARLERWVDRVERELAADASEGGIEVDGAKVEAELPRAGIAIDGEALRERAEERILDDDALSITAPTDDIEPEMTGREVRRAKRRAEKILDGPVVLRHAGDEAKLAPEQIGAALSIRNVDDGGEVRIRIGVDADELGKAVERSLDDLGREPQNASFTLSNGGVKVVGGRPGTEVDAEKLTDSLLRIATSDDRSGPAPVRQVRPEFSTKDARALNIDEQVSSFTTHHSCCEPRVENIHRIADIIDGTVVRPGETFSINDTVGPRTRDKGFVPAPAILDGEYVDEVGGGISQFATTMFNAIFFGGYQFEEYKAHSYYISRYPMGREATVSNPYPDLAFTNDSNAGIYIDTGYTDTSITVTFYGQKQRNVESVSGDPHNYKSPETQCKRNKSLKRGQRRVIQEGSRGFDITVTRVFGNGDREPFHTTYLPVPEIVERRKC